MAGRNIEDKIRCSFCGKSQEQVRKMIAGPNGAFICDECVEVCTEIIEEEFEEEENVQPEGMAEEIHLYKPEELKAFLDEYVIGCLLYTSPSPRDLSTSRMPSSA